MASRNMTISDTEFTLEDLLKILKEENASEDSPMDVRNIAVELDTTDTSAIMVMVKDHPLILDYDRGLVWLKYPEDTIEELLASVAPVKAIGKPAAKPKAQKPGPTIAELTKPVRKAVTPVKTQSGETVTVPVDFDDPDKGRRELDASAGERVLSEDNMKDILKGVRREDKIVTETGWTNTEHASKLDPNHESGQYLAPRENIPAPPEGINWNMWELAWTAPTAPARKYWYSRCLADLERWNADAPKREAARKAAEEEAAELAAAEAEAARKAAEEEPVRLCPITGEILPF